ncbi:hypothetical protein ABK040_007316 [Willaertia magna]
MKKTQDVNLQSNDFAGEKPTTNVSVKPPLSKDYKGRGIKQEEWNKGTGTDLTVGRDLTNTAPSDKDAKNV